MGEPGQPQDLWALAYHKLEREESDLMKEYKSYLSTSYGVTIGQDDPPTTQMVRSVVKQLTGQREKKQWGFSMFGMKIVVREQVEKLMKFLLWSDAIVKDAISAQPYAALAWSGVSMLLPLVQSQMGKHQAMLDGFVLINNVQLYWKVGEKTYLQASEGSDRQELTDALVEVYTEIFKYQIMAILHLSKSQLSRAWKAMGQDWTEQSAHVETLSNRCSEKMPLAQHLQTQQNWGNLQQKMNESVDILSQILQFIETDKKEARKYEEDQRKGALYQDLASNYEGDKNFNPQRLKDTCRWFLEDKKFRDWRDTSASTILLVYAGPGFGKSVLSRSLIDERLLSTRPTTSTVCYFFFKDGYTDRDNGASALAAILHQLFSQDSTGALINLALDYHGKWGKGLARNLDQLWEIFLDCVKSPEAGEVICVLDALDECTKDYPALIEKLKEFYGEQQKMDECKLKLLITCRPYDHVMESFEFSLENNPSSSFMVDEKTEEISGDIDSVIDHEVGIVAKRFKDSDRQKLSRRLKGMENRTYLWLKLILDIIRDKRSVYSKASKIESLISDLPTEVSEAYEKILSRNQDEDQTELLLQIVLASNRPLTLQEANYALTLALNEPEVFSSHGDLDSDLWSSESIKSVVENLCGLFISVYDSKLYFIHQTARSFLIDSPPRDKWKGRLNMQKAHATLALCCIRYLPLLYPPSTWETSSHIEQVMRQDYPFVGYAATSWMSHFKSLGEVPSLLRKEGRGLFHGPKELCKLWLPVWRSELQPREGSFWLRSPDLTLASYFGLAPLVQDILRDGGYDINHQGPIGTAIQAAASEGHDEIVRLLLQKGADANIGGGVYMTPLMAASVEGHMEVVKTLLRKEHGVNINAKDSIYGTALDKALRRAHIEIVDYFLKLREDWNITDDTLISAIQTQEAAQAVQLLLRYKPDAIVITSDVISAAETYGTEALELLLREKSDTLEITDEVLETLFESFGVGVVRLLFEKRGDEIEITEELVEAAAENFSGDGVMEWLLDECGDEITITHTVLERAAENWEMGDKIVSILLKKRPEEVKVTDSVVRAAKSNPYCGVKVLKVFEEHGLWTAK